MIEIIVLLIGLAVGLFLGWLWAQRRASSAQGTIAELRTQIEKAEEDFGTLRQTLDVEREARVKAETELANATRSFEEQKRFIEEARTRLTDTFKALSADALKDSSGAFVERAEALMKPLNESLKRYEDHVQALEQSRQKAYGSLEEQLKALGGAHRELTDATGNLVNALRRPEVRGRWGELTLRRVVELAGMSEHCDFTEQVSVESETGVLRPDMIIHLPSQRDVVVDAKVPLSAYMEAIEVDSEEERARLLGRHAEQVRSHMRRLSQKGYWDQFAHAPDFVVMFIPGESFFSAAVQQRPELLEEGMRQRVVLGTPTTLIVLLWSVAYGWRQEQLAQNAQEISDLGRQLYERMTTLADHISEMGKGLERANQAYNRAVGSMEHRVFPAARRFKDLGVTAGADIPAIEPLETAPRKLNPPEPPEESG